MCAFLTHHGVPASIQVNCFSASFSSPHYRRPEYKTEATTKNRRKTLAVITPARFNIRQPSLEHLHFFEMEAGLDVQQFSASNEFDETYEDYLDKQITPTDLYYLEDVELGRQLVEFG